MDDDFDIELSRLEADHVLRTRLDAGDPKTRRMVYTWCEGAAAEILRYVAHGHVIATADTDGLWEGGDLAASDWRYRVLDGESVLVEFRADGTWTTRGAQGGGWFGIIEGSPEYIGRCIAHDLGLPFLPHNPRRRPGVRALAEDTAGRNETAHLASPPGTDEVVDGPSASS